MRMPDLPPCPDTRILVLAIWNSDPTVGAPAQVGMEPHRGGERRGGARKAPTHRPTKDLCKHEQKTNSAVTVDTRAVSSASAAPSPAAIATTTAVNPQNGRAKPTASWKDTWAPTNRPPAAVSAARCAKPACRGRGRPRGAAAPVSVQLHVPRALRHG